MKNLICHNPECGKEYSVVYKQGKVPKYCSRHCQQITNYKKRYKPTQPKIIHGLICHNTACNKIYSAKRQTKYCSYDCCIFYNNNKHKSDIMKMSVCKNPNCKNEFKNAGHGNFLYCQSEKCIENRKRFILGQKTIYRLDQTAKQRKLNKVTAPKSDKVNPIHLQHMTPNQIEKYIREGRVI